MTAVVAITQRVVEDPVTGERRDALAQNWTTWLAAVAPEIVMAPVPNRLTTSARSAWLDVVRPRALILTGGGTRGEAPERDRTEDALLDHFLGCGAPILGVCRGMQVLNLHFGGTTRPGAADPALHVAVTHEVAWADDVLGARGDVQEVNSFHDDLITAADLATPLRVLGTAPDGSVEALVHAAAPILGVLWHPERPGPSAEFDHAWFRRWLDLLTVPSGDPVPCAP